jgi:hypothetical protein
MKLVLLFGPPAVGKMTVGYELAALTGLKLFHNHMTIDLVLNFFDYEHPAFKLVKEFRTRILEEIAASELPGAIFTYVWAFNSKSDEEYIEQLADIFRKKGGDVLYVEIQAAFEKRLERNRTEFRLANKPSKRNLDHSEKFLRDAEQKYKLSSDPGYFSGRKYLRIDNTDLTPADVANSIVKYFNLPTVH